MDTSSVEGDALSFAVQLARQAGDLLMQYYGSEDLVATLKVDHSVVTEADIAADDLIAASIHQFYPDDFLMSEEHQSAYPLHEFQSDRGVWIVDPLDGTTNFSLGIPIWGVMLARLVGGWPETGVLYFPVLGELYSAQLGQGAFYNGAPLQVQPPSSRRPLSFFSCCSRTYRFYQVNVPYKTRIFGSTGYSLCALAHSIAIVSFDAAPKIWDIAAAWLVVSESGGVIETLDHSQPFPLQPGIDYSQRHFPTLAAANQELAARARQQILSRE